VVNHFGGKEKHLKNVPILSVSLCIHTLEVVSKTKRKNEKKIVRGQITI